MSKTIQHKLLNLEVTPPEHIWQQLEEELNTMSGDREWMKRLNDQEVTPPVSAWASIEKELIAAPANDLPSKLLEAEVTPPAAIWNEIEKKLDAAPSKKTYWYRYAAAAALIGLMVLGAARYIPFSSPSTVASSDIRKPETFPLVTKPSVTIDNDLPVVTQEQIDDRALEQSKKTYARVDFNKKQRSQIASGFRFASGNDANAVEPVCIDMNERYVVLMTPEGNFIRVSKKLGNLVCCVSGEEDDKNCKDQVDKWQKQLACSNVTHAGNFGDILNLVSALQEDQ